MSQERGHETEEIGEVLRGELESLNPVGHDTRPDSDSSLEGLLASDDPAWLSSCESEATLRARNLQRTLAQEVAEARADPAHRFGRYVLLSELGRGGFGAVFRAYDPQLERLVAIKVLLRANSQVARERFQREVRVTARLHHPHIAGIHDSGELNGLPFLVMDYVQGRTLEELVNLELRSLEPRQRMLQAATLMRDVSRAVAYAHKQGILHRDIKPPNVLVDERGHAYLVDFGLARLRESLSDLTQPGTAIGTPLFMAPEQAMGQATSKSIDIYALGATLFFALTGRPPHLAESVTDFYDKLKAGAEPPSTYDPHVPPELDAICAEALETRPEDRTPSAERLAALLADFVEQAPLAEAINRQVQPLVIGLVALAVVLLGVLVSIVPGEGDPVRTERPPATSKQEEQRQREAAREILRKVGAGSLQPQTGVLMLVKADSRFAVEELVAWLNGVCDQLLHRKTLDGARSQAAAMACEAIGHLGRQEPDVAALGRYLRLAPHEAGRKVALGALRRIGTEESERVVGKWHHDQRQDKERELLRRGKRQAQAAEHVRLAKQDLEQGRNAEAEVRLERALALVPKHLDAMRGMARVRFRRRDFTGCVATVSAVIARDPKQPYDWVLRGMAKSWLEQRGGAAADFVEAIRLDPKHRKAWNQLSAISKHVGTRLWRETAEAVLKTAPNNGHALFSLAFLCSQRRDWKAALHYADRLVRTDGGALGAKGLYLRGVVKLRLRDVVGARTDLQRFIKLAPKDPSVGAARRMLEKLP